MAEGNTGNANAGGNSTSASMNSKYRPINFNAAALRKYINGMNSNIPNTRLTKNGFKGVNNNNKNVMLNLDPKSISNNNQNLKNIKNNNNKLPESYRKLIAVNTAAFNTAVSATNNNKVNANTLKTHFENTNTVIKEYATIEENFRPLADAWAGFPMVLGSEIFTKTFPANVKNNNKPHNGFFTRKIGVYKSGNNNVVDKNVKGVTNKMPILMNFMGLNNSQNKPTRIVVLKKILEVTRDLLKSYNGYIKSKLTLGKKLLLAAKRLNNAMQKKKASGLAKSKTASTFNKVVVNVVSALVNVKKQMNATIANQNTTPSSGNGFNLPVSTEANNNNNQLRIREATGRINRATKPEELNNTLKSVINKISNNDIKKELLKKFNNKKASLSQPASSN